MSIIRAGKAVEEFVEAAIEFAFESRMPRTKNRVSWDDCVSEETKARKELTLNNMYAHLKDRRDIG